MPVGYERMRDRFMKEGMSKKAAQKKAARIWNDKNPDNPVGGHKRKKKRKRGPRKKLVRRKTILGRGS